jgi:hypothetical protein
MAAAGVLALSAPGSALAETRLVDDDGAATATDCNEGAPNSAFATIQAAVNAANPLDTVKVCRGTFPSS